MDNGKWTIGIYQLSVIRCSQHFNQKWKLGHDVSDCKRKVNIAGRRVIDRETKPQGEDQHDTYGQNGKHYLRKSTFIR